MDQCGVCQGDDSSCCNLFCFLKNVHSANENLLVLFLQLTVLGCRMDLQQLINVEFAKEMVRAVVTFVFFLHTQVPTSSYCQPSALLKSGGIMYLCISHFSTPDFYAFRVLLTTVIPRGLAYFFTPFKPSYLTIFPQMKKKYNFFSVASYFSLLRTFTFPLDL